MIINLVQHGLDMGPDFDPLAARHAGWFKPVVEVTGVKVFSVNRSLRRRSPWDKIVLHIVIDTGQDYGGGFRYFAACGQTTTKKPTTLLEVHRVYFNMRHTQWSSRHRICLRCTKALRARGG